MTNGKIRLAAVVASGVLAGCAGPAAMPGNAEVTAMAEAPSERVVFDFSDGETVSSWRAVNDTVMGGVSSSRMVASADGAAFEGVLSLENYGGFATVRSPFGATDLRGFDGLALHVRGDGRTYKVCVKTNGRDDGYQYQADFTPQTGTWQTVRVPFADFRPRYRGMAMPLWPKLDAGAIRSIGLMIADKQEGPFRLGIGWLRAYR